MRGGQVIRAELEPLRISNTPVSQFALNLIACVIALCVFLALALVIARAAGSSSAGQPIGEAVFACVFLVAADVFGAVGYRIWNRRLVVTSGSITCYNNELIYRVDAHVIVRIDCYKPNRRWKPPYWKPLVTLRDGTSF
jgi:hypothetical protein